jgi:dephospho-CoA kinase
MSESSHDRKMLRIALTGGIATGKSHVLEQFRRLGVPCLDADELTHGVTAAGTEATAAIAAHFGSSMLAADGAVDRRKLGPIVFSDAAARRDLEAIVHPAVYRAITAGLNAFEKIGTYPMAVVDIPLLYETGHAGEFDKVIVTSCPPEMQLARLIARDIPETEARQRLAAQWPTGEKAARADFVIKTDGTFEETDTQVRRLFEELTRSGQFAPGVRVDETPLRGRTIDAVGASTAGFVGPARSGPFERAQALTSVAEFEQLYGDGRPLPSGGDGTAPQFLWHAVRAFFAEGGTRAYVVRTRDDGGPPAAAAYEAALHALEEPADVSIVAAPGSTYVAAGAQAADRARADAITDLLIRHAEQMRYRIAVLDSVNGADAEGVRAQRERIDSSYAALYYPWLRATDPHTSGDVLLPPSGFVAGVYARVDAQRGVSKAPANEVVRLAAGLERTIDPAQEELLNAAGINSFRGFTDRSVVLWGARTATSDPGWKYVNIRRYAAFLELSIDQGLQWAVFEPNGEPLWSNVRSTVEDFLTTQWRTGALLGNAPEQAYFVRCDPSTMTQQDLDQGRLVCLVGVALLKPAEFVIFRIGLWTADHRP